MLRKKSTYLIIVLAVALLLVFKPCRDLLYKISADFFYPFFSLPVKLKSSIGSMGYLMGDREELVSQLVKLQKKISKLEGRCKYLQNFKDENNELRELLNLRPLPNFKYTIAEITYRDPARWYNQFTINKGSSSGIEDGALVLGRIKNTHKEKAQFGVIGRIGALSKHTSIVYTILSNECQISVVIPENGATGILHGGERRGTKIWSNILFLPKDIQYKGGSIVVTSGLTPLAPKGITIGNILNSENNAPNDLFAKVAVEPAVDLAHIDFILVLGKQSTNG